MTRLEVFTRWVILLSLNKTRALAYNLALNEETAKFIVSPVVDLFGSVVSDGSEIQPSYFGYSFELYKNAEDDVAVMIGSPKMNDPADEALQDLSVKPQQPSRGNIQHCTVTESLFSGKAPICLSAYPPNPQSGDNLGLVLSARPNGEVIACSPTRVQDCGAVRYSPGSCFKSENYGKTWAAAKGTKPKRCPTTDVEVLFALDGSGSVGEENFLTVKEWVKEISRKIGLDKGRVTVGVVQYSHYSEKHDINNQPWIVTHIEIGKYRAYESFSAEVDKIKLQGFTTYTGRALRKVVTDFQNTKHYNQSSNKQVMILLTDGIATDSQLVRINAEKLRNMGVIPYAIGVGDDKEINRTELRLIANGDPKNDTRVFLAANFDGLSAIAKELEAEIGGLVLEGESPANGTVYDLQFAQMALSSAFGKYRTSRRRRTTGDTSERDEALCDAIR